MPRLRTDDGPRKLRAVWLGPAGGTLPFQWTYVQWLVTLVAIPIGAAAGGFLLSILGAGLVWTLSVGVLWGGAAGVWVAVKVMRHVTYDEPLRYLQRLVRGEFSRAFSTGVELGPIMVDHQTADRLPVPLGGLPVDGMEHASSSRSIVAAARRSTRT